MRLFRKYCSPSQPDSHATNQPNEKSRLRVSKVSGASTNSRVASRAFPASKSSAPSGSDFSKKLPAQLLTEILSYICPHAVDDSYDSPEESTTEDGCMLCDMRDLARCALVNKRWYTSGQRLLYQHVRIDAVHYCELEIELALKRKSRRSLVNEHGKKLDVPQSRLHLFMRTVRESQRLADMVLSLRLPYMTRETSQADLARTVSVLRNLRYVDLPAGFFTDDSSSFALRQELMVKCPDIRRMTYARGSEASFSEVASSARWKNLESLELSSLQIEEITLRQVLAAFPSLRILKMDNLPAITDSVFTPNRFMPSLPPISKLHVRNMPAITADGLAVHLSDPCNQQALVEIVLAGCGVSPESLNQIFSRAPRLLVFKLSTEVNKTFPVHEVPPLVSNSLKTMHYEISRSGSASGLQNLAKPYYSYLITSLMSNNLPSLRNLYVLDPSFADILLLSPPPQLLTGTENILHSRASGLQSPLTLYAKGVDNFEWIMTEIQPTSSGRRSSRSRPVSLHSAQLSPRWGGAARQSMVVGNGFGGFLAIPKDEGGPVSGGWGGGKKRDSRYDLWR